MHTLQIFSTKKWKNRHLKQWNSLAILDPTGVTYVFCYQILFKLCIACFIKCMLSEIFFYCLYCSSFFLSPVPNFPARYWTLLISEKNWKGRYMWRKEDRKICQMSVKKCHKIYGKEIRQNVNNSVESRCQRTRMESTNCPSAVLWVRVE